ncbi:hypothetical protein CHUAL_009939 [Chamberlinius hualienensis]
MPSQKQCDYCYCIRGNQRCIKPQCHLPIEECQPIYNEEFSCCPTAYKCSKYQNKILPITTTIAPSKFRGCEVNGTFYEEGTPVINEDVCQNCFCVNGKVECSVTRCDIEFNGCTPIIQPGKCCPTGYNCSDNFELSTTAENEIIIESRIGDDLTLNETSTATESLDDEPTTDAEAATTELNEYLSTTTTSDISNDYVATTLDEAEITTESGLNFEERSDVDPSTEFSLSATESLDGRVSNSNEQTTLAPDGLDYSLDISTIDNSDITETASEYSVEVSTYLPNSEVEEARNAEEINESATETLESTTEDTNVTEAETEFENVKEISYRTSMSNNGSSHLHNMTAELLQNVAGQLLVNNHNEVDSVSDNNFTNWTHLDNETDLMQTSNQHEILTNNQTDVPSSKLQGSLHSIVNSLLNISEVTTEGNNNYTFSIEDLIGEAPGEFDFHSINYYNFSDGEHHHETATVENDLSTPSSYRENFYPTVAASNATDIQVNETLPQVNDNNSTHFNDSSSQINETTLEINNSSSVIEIENELLDKSDSLLKSSEKSHTTPSTETVTSTVAHTISSTTESVKNLTETTEKLSEVQSFEEVNNTSDVLLQNETEHQYDDEFLEHYDGDSDSTVVEGETETTTIFPEGDLESTIEMILNLSKTLAAASKRPTQYHPSENSSATDLLSGTLPAEVEAKLTEIIRMAQAGHNPNDNPFSNFNSPLNVTFNYDEATTHPPLEDEYYDDYYDADTKEPTVFESQTSTAVSEPTTTPLQQHDTTTIINELHPITSSSPRHFDFTTINTGADHIISTTEQHHAQTTTNIEHFGHAEVVEANEHQTSSIDNVNTELSERVDYDHVESQVNEQPSEKYQSQLLNDEFPQSMSESVVAENDDQVAAGSSIHQDEQPLNGGESETAFGEPADEEGDENPFDGLTAADNNEEKSYFSSDDTFDSPHVVEPAFEQPDSEVVESQVPTEVLDHIRPEEHQTEKSDVHEIHATQTEDLPELQPELIKDFIENVQFEHKETTKEHAETSTTEILTSTLPTVIESANKRTEPVDDINNLDKSEIHDVTAGTAVTEPLLPTEAAKNETSQPFVGLVTKGSIQFDQIVPLSRRGRPTVDEKTGQALPTPRKSNSSNHQVSTPSADILPPDEDAPAVIPFLPEDAITDQHLLKEPPFRNGGSEKSADEPSIIVQPIVHNRSDFTLQVSASTAIDVHDAQAPVTNTDADGEGVAIPEPFDYVEETAELTVKPSTTTTTTPATTTTTIVTTTTTTTHRSLQRNQTDAVTTEAPMKVANDQQEAGVVSSLTGSPLPKFDESFSDFGFQQTPEYCVENGEVFQDGERIPTHDFCAQCRCVKGEIQCQHLSCPRKPDGCIEKIVPSSCCPAFVCNETEAGNAPIRSGITIHSGFLPIERPVLPLDQQLPSRQGTKSTTDNTTPITTTRRTTSTEAAVEEHGIFSSLLEAVLGHGETNSDAVTERPDDFDSGVVSSANENKKNSSTFTPNKRTTKITATSTTTTTTTTTTAAPTTRRRVTTTTTTVQPVKKQPFDSLWPMLKVSSCNIYGRVYALGATIGVLSGPCKECKCTSTGVDCYKVKCF